MTDTPRFPDFFVLGAMKAGTTSLHHYVTQHPDVLVQADKEPTYFASDGTPPVWLGPGDDQHVVRRRAWDEAAYLDMYARAPGVLAGDFSVQYLPLPEVPDRLLSAVPDARLVVILRDPVLRAHSAWKMWRQIGRETLSFRDALEAEEERRAAGWAPVWWYRDLGRYGEQVARWLDRGGDDRMLVVRTEDLARDPVGVVQTIYTHIGLDPTFEPDTRERLNVRTSVPRSSRVQRWIRDTRSSSKRLAMKVPAPVRRRAGAALRRGNTAQPKIDAAVAAELRRGYAEDLALLGDRTGLDVRHWIRPTDTR